MTIEVVGKTRLWARPTGVSTRLNVDGEVAYYHIEYDSNDYLQKEDPSSGKFITLEKCDEGYEEILKAIELADIDEHEIM